MALTPRLELRQSQQLVMTPQLQQAIKLLQLSNLDLAAYVEQELEKNPLLERSDALEAQEANSGAVEQESAPASADNDDTPLKELSISNDGTSPDDGNSTPEADYDNTYNDTVTDMPAEQSFADGANTGYLGANSGGSSSFSSNDLNLENTLSEDISLRDHLAQQLNQAPLSNSQKLIASYMIDLVSDAGYFMEELNDVAETLGCGRGAVETVFTALRAMEPVGIFATDLADCLALQLIDQNRFDPAIEALLSNLNMLAEGNLKGLLEICDVDQEDLREMISEIKALDPKPGLQFDSEVAQTVIPDIFVRRRPDSTWHIELNSETLPKVLVNNSYYSVLNTKTKKKEEKEYLSDCLSTANWLVKSLDQRAQTILKVATALVAEQEMFFTQGIEFLRPLNLKTIADTISMHESTVSRVTSNKYIASQRGIFELKYFFTSAINSTSGGDSHSAASVRHKLKRLIDDEAPNKILSDDKIVELMKLEGIDIARRTVAKYRDAMKIPSSVQRRRLKKQLIAS